MSDEHCCILCPKLPPFESRYEAEKHVRDAHREIVAYGQQPVGRRIPDGELVIERDFEEWYCDQKRGDRFATHIDSCRGADDFLVECEMAPDGPG